MGRHIVGRVDEVPPGTRKLVNVRGRPVVLFNLAGEFFGLHNTCPHEGGSLCHGTVTGFIGADEPGSYRLERAGEVIRCPWHGWEFDIKTGKSWCLPSRVRAKRYDVTVASGATLVEGPYKAETVPVSVEDDYILVEL